MKKLFSLSLLFLLLANPVGMSAKKNQMKHPPKYVFFIGFDGMAARSFREGVDMPCYRQLMAQGSYTLHKRSVLPSASALNWITMYNGGSPEHHGYHKWNSKKPDFAPIYQNEDKFFPDVFYLLKKKHPKAQAVHFYAWTGMRYVVDTLRVDYLKQMPMQNVQQIDEMMDYICEHKPTLTSIAFDDPDETGHAKGFGSDEYHQKMKQLDGLLARIVERIKGAGMWEESVIILTSDHGGEFITKHHGGTTLDELETPFVIVGKGIRQGWVIPECVMGYDMAGTMAYILGLDIPQPWVGKPIMSVFK